MQNPVPSIHMKFHKFEGQQQIGNYNVQNHHENHAPVNQPDSSTGEQVKNFEEPGLGIELERNWDECELPDVVQCSADGFLDKLKKDKIYPMNADPLGHVLMINVNMVKGAKEGRKGSKKDGEAIEKLWTGLHFEACDYLYDDDDGLSAQEIKEKVKGFFSSKMHKRSDAAVMALLSHGGTDSQGQFIYGTDGEKVYLKELFSMMTGCKYLDGKPKIVLIQACRGARFNKVGEYKDDQFIEDRINVERKPKDEEKDTVYVYSSLPGSLSFRSVCSGSLMIQIVYKALAKYAASHDVLTLLKQIDADIKNKRIKYKPDPEATTGDIVQPELDIRYSLTDDKKLYLITK